jgi:hypothetical protein
MVRSGGSPLRRNSLVKSGFKTSKRDWNGYEGDVAKRQALPELSHAGKGSALVGVRTELDSFRLEMSAM